MSGGGRDEGMSVLPGEPRRAKEQLPPPCVPGLHPASSLWWAPGQQLGLLDSLGFSKGPTDPTSLQSPREQVHHDIELWLRARGLPSGGLEGTSSPATSCVTLSLSLNLLEILLCSEGKNRTCLMRSS